MPAGRASRPALLLRAPPLRCMSLNITATVLSKVATQMHQGFIQWLATREAAKARQHVDRTGVTAVHEGRS